MGNGGDFRDEFVVVYRLQNVNPSRCDESLVLAGTYGNLVMEDFIQQTRRLFGPRGGDRAGRTFGL